MRTYTVALCWVIGFERCRADRVMQRLVVLLFFPRGRSWRQCPQFRAGLIVLSRGFLVGRDRAAVL